MIGCFFINTYTFFLPLPHFCPLPTIPIPGNIVWIRVCDFFPLYFFQINVYYVFLQPSMKHSTKGVAIICDASSSQTMGLSPQALWWKRESMRITRGLPTMAIIVVSRWGPQFRENICCLICKRKWRISRHDGKVNVELPCTCLLKCCCQRTVAYMTGRLVSELHKFMRLIYFKRPLAERFRYEPNNDSWMVKGGGGSCTYTRSVTFISTKQRFLDYRQFKITREMRYLLINNFHFNTYCLIYLKVKS